MPIELVHDSLEHWVSHYQGDKYHVAIGDPPYHLDSIVKRFSKEGSAAPQSGVYQRSSKGFLGKGWDGGDIAFRSDTWAMIAEHLYPGAFVVMFAAARGYHRMAVAMEDAGLIPHPSIFMIGWLYGSGFGKPHNLKEYPGYAYSRQALKPALEPILVFQKPYEGSGVQSINRYGAGVYHMAGGRIPTEDTWVCSSRQDFRSHRIFDGVKERIEKPNESHPLGRWPSNVILIHDMACTPDHCVDQCPINMIGDQNGLDNEDSGTAARYYYQANWNDEVEERIALGDQALYIPKPTKEERELGLEALPGRKVNDGRDTPIDNG